MSRSERRGAIKAAIEATADKLGRIIPERVIEAARNKKNPLYPKFPWDDSIAGHQYRLIIARNLISEIRYEVEDTTEREGKIKYVHDATRPKEQGYVSITNAARNKTQARAIMESEMSRCESAIGRAREVCDILRLRDELDKVLERIVIIKTKIRLPTKIAASRSRQNVKRKAA